MKWQTIQAVKNAAARGPKAALKASRVHWTQLCAATPGELDDEGVSLLKSEKCALCERHYKYKNKECGVGCVVFVSDNYCNQDGSPWIVAWHAFKEMPQGSSTTSPEWKRWQKAAHKMLSVLEGLL